MTCYIDYPETLQYYYALLTLLIFVLSTLRWKFKVNLTNNEVVMPTFNYGFKIV